MSGLLFPFKDLIAECETILTHAKDYLDAASFGGLRSAKTFLQNLQVGNNLHVVSWKIPQNSPLRTQWSDGESQRDGKSKYKVRAEFSFVWHIRKFTEGGERSSKYFLLDGIASTVTKLVAEINGEERMIGRWTTDVGDQNSPGTHFHFQFNREDSEEFPFPKALDVPRLPAPVMTPFFAVDLALGELFQDRWKRHSLTESKHSRTWGNLHRDRVLRFLKWQAECVRKSSGSPWMAIKVAKPQRDLLVVDAK